MPAKQRYLPAWKTFTNACCRSTRLSGPTPNPVSRSGARRKNLQGWLSENGFNVQAGGGRHANRIRSDLWRRANRLSRTWQNSMRCLACRKKPCRTGKRGDDPAVIAGHGCGHSVFGTGTTAAAISLARVMAEKKPAGNRTLVRYTCRRNCRCQDVYAEGRALSTMSTWCCPGTRVTKPAPASVTRKRSLRRGLHSMAYPRMRRPPPEFGKSALDAVELMNIGVNYLREHVPQDTRIHYVVTDGGGQPNVVPGRKRRPGTTCALTGTIPLSRSTPRSSISPAGRALMTGTTMRVVVEGDSHEVLPNRALSDIISNNLGLVGAAAI